jgi:hypothetical protein
MVIYGIGPRSKTLRLLIFQTVVSASEDFLCSILLWCCIIKIERAKWTYGYVGALYQLLPHSTHVANLQCLFNMISFFLCLYVLSILLNTAWFHFWGHNKRSFILDRKICVLHLLIIGWINEINGNSTACFVRTTACPLLCARVFKLVCLLVARRGGTKTQATHCMHACAGRWSVWTGMLFSSVFLVDLFDLSHSDLPPWALTSSCCCMLVAMSRFYHYFCHYLAFSAMPACHWCHIHAKLCFSLLIKNQFPELFAHCPVYFCTFVAINVQLMIGSPQAELCFLV